mgnify:CR=1 FL=1
MEGFARLDMAFIFTDSGGTSINTATVNTEITGKWTTGPTDTTYTEHDVRALYIDWDDGVSNDREEANYQWKEFTQPVSGGTAKHTYNATGVYYPVRQTINSQGIASHYYQQSGGNAEDDLVPLTEDNSGVYGVLTVSDDVATANMRVENTTVQSGIDNSVFEEQGPRALYLTIPPTLTSTELGYLSTIDIEVTALVAKSTVGEATTLMTGAMTGRVNTGYDLSVQKATGSLGSLTTTTSIFQVDYGEGSSVSKVLKVKYLNPKITGTYENDYTRNAALNYLRVFLVAFGNDDTTLYPVAYVSAGSPVKSLDDNKRYITMDFSQSRAAASNVTNSFYRYDNGKSWFGPDVNRWALSANKFTDTTKQSSSLKEVHYTYNPRPDGIGGESDGTMGTAYTWPWGTGSQTTTTDANAAWWVSGTALTAQRTNQFGLDDYGRFFNQYHLVRNSMEPSSGAGNVSSLTGNKVTLARITPVIDVQASNNDATKFDEATVGEDNYTADYTAAAFNNSGTNAAGRVSLSGMNTALFEGWDGATREAQEYLIALWDAKTNKIFFQCTPWWSGSYDRAVGTDISSGVEGLKIAGVSYLKVNNSGTVTQECEWVPLDFEDTTASSTEYRDTSQDKYIEVSNSFTKSGYVSFNMPSDWSSIKMEELYGGNITSGASATEVATIGEDNKVSDTGSTMAANGGALFTVNVNSLVAAKDGYGQTIVCDSPGVTTSIRDAMDDIGSDADVGAFNYIAEVVSDVHGSNLDLQNMWVAYINGDNKYTNGYYRDASDPADDRLYLHFGEANGTDYALPSVGNDLDIVVKRINFYEVFPGASKLYKGGVYLNPLDAGARATFPNEYGFKDYTAGAALALKSAWSGSSKYPLLITISGSNGVAPGGSSTNIPYPEIWNVMDASQGFTTIIKEVDDSAYNLNSLSITSDVSVGRGSNFFRAITRKGKTYVVKTGIKLTQIGFTSVALGDENDSVSDNFDNKGPSSLYGHLHKIRNIQADAVRVYWDEPQKDGTFVRFWGVVSDVTDTRSVGGPRAIMNYTFNMIIEDIAIIDGSGVMLTDIYPLGGIPDERNYS